MKIGVVGGGVNGLCCAWELSRQGHDVTLFERGELMQRTSRASSKLLHGGLRYLENFEFRLVREALRERDGWLMRVPSLAQPLRLVVPIYGNSRRGRWMVGAGLLLYRILAPRSPFGDFLWLSAEELQARDPNLNGDGLVGGWEFSDGQMDDYQLGLWVAEQVRSVGGEIHEHAPVERVSTEGEVVLEGGEVHRFERVVNVAGPWAEELARASGVDLPYQLDLVRGSHLVLNQPCPQAYLLEVVGERRVFFVLPWKDGTLLGTTEVRQSIDEPIECSEEEERYLLDAYAAYFETPAEPSDIAERFAGVRPLIKSARNPNRASREYELHRTDRLLTVMGGKWTTALALGKQVARRVKRRKTDRGR